MQMSQREETQFCIYKREINLVGQIWCKISLYVSNDTTEMNFPQKQGVPQMLAI
jgi:hypothetical protein